MALLGFLFGFFAGYALLWLIIPVLRRSFLDHPNERSSHSSLIPRGGGSVFVLLASSSSALALLVSYKSAVVTSSLHAAPLIILPLAFVGFLDDRFNLPSILRYGVQLCTALVLIRFSSLVATSFRFLPLLVLLVIAVTAVINFTNFMDGLDGLVAGCMTVSIAAAAIQLSAPWPIWVLLGALLGFLLWNWSPAKVFMGDVGSTYLGAIFAALLLQAASWPQSFALLLLATPLLGDACFCVVRRLIAGQRVFQAHRLHLFQRLHQAGWPHARVSSFYIFATAALAAAFLLGGFPWLISFSVFEGLIGVWLDQQIAVPFAVAARA